MIARLKEYLRSRQLLLVLDNFELVLDAAGLVSDLLAGCPALKILVTSRTALWVYGEQELSVSPLVLPDLKSPLKLQAIAKYPSVMLFLQRAQAVKPDFALTEANASAIAQEIDRLVMTMR